MTVSFLLLLIVSVALFVWGAVSLIRRGTTTRGGTTGPAPDRRQPEPPVTRDRSAPDGAGEPGGQPPTYGAPGGRTPSGAAVNWQSPVWNVVGVVSGVVGAIVGVIGLFK